MKKNVLLLCLLFVFTATLFAQDASETFRFKNEADEQLLKDINEALVVDNFLGEEVALKMHLLKETYTYIIPASPQTPGERVEISKPSIYNSLKKLNRYYKKQVKKDILTKEEAAKRFSTFLDIGYSVFNQNTDELEEALRKVRKPEEIEAVFSRIVLY